MHFRIAKIYPVDKSSNAFPVIVEIFHEQRILRRRRQKSKKLSLLTRLNPFSSEGSTGVTHLRVEFDCEFIRNHRAFRPPASRRTKRLILAGVNVAGDVAVTRIEWITRARNDAVADGWVPRR